MISEYIGNVLRNEKNKKSLRKHSKKFNLLADAKPTRELVSRSSRRVTEDREEIVVI